MTAPRIAVLGAGANGAAIGADLVNAGHHVDFIDQWPAHVEAMRASGITVTTPDRTTVTRVRAHHLCEVAEMREPFDIVFLSTKSYDTRWSVNLIAPLLHDRSVVVGLQNGMTIDDVAEIVGAERTIGAVLGIAANLPEPGQVVRQVPVERTWFTIGTLDGENSPELELVATLLRHAGTVEISTDIRSSKWMKLITNIPEMLPSAILGLPLLGAVGHPGIRAVMDASAREAYRLALDDGAIMLPILGKTADDVPDSDQYALDLLDAVLNTFSLPDTRVAVLQDWEKGRRAELDGFNGFVVSRRAALGGSAPVTEAILHIGERIERGELIPSLANADMLRALVHEPVLIPARNSRHTTAHRMELP